MSTDDLCNCGAPATCEFEEGGEWFLLCDGCEVASRPDCQMTARCQLEGLR